MRAMACWLAQVSLCKKMPERQHDTARTSLSGSEERKTKAATENDIKHLNEVMEKFIIKKGTGTETWESDHLMEVQALPNPLAAPV